MSVIAVFLSVVVIVAGSPSPHADYIEELIRTNAFGGRISDNILEDATLDLPDLVRKYNYPFEEHFVTTEDGYILGMHRIPHGRVSYNVSGDRPVVFLMHGWPTSSSDHVIMGPGSGIAYILADEGYDVWMGNTRGNSFSRKHISLNPDVPRNGFWEFSWDEIGERDLPAMIDYALQHTGRSALHYIGFSQGTTVFFVMGSLRPEYNKKIISMHAMAPVAYMEHVKDHIFMKIAPYGRDLTTLASLLGIEEILSHHEIFTLLGRLFCIDGAKTQPFCSAIIFLIAGWNENQHNASTIPIILGHTPAGCSVKQMAHFGQSITDKEFRRYDFGLLQNLQKYGTPIPPSYDLSKVTAPVFLHYSEGDPLAVVADVDRLFKELGRPMGKFKVSQSTFSHVDFMWGIDAKKMVYDKVINFMRLMDLKN
nr:lipase 1-like [Vanessa tameamea]